VSAKERTAWTDSLGRQVALARPPRRIVSLVPSITETLFAFGLDKRIAGVTRYCVEPAEAVATKPRVGGTKNADTAAVVALKPDLVIANVEENEQADIEALEAAGLTVFVTYPRSVAAGIEMMRTLAAITDTGDRASDIIAAAEGAAALVRAASQSRPRLRVFCPIWRNPWMTINSDTYIHDLLETCGLDNIYAAAKERYPRIELAAAEAMSPDVILLPDEPYRFSRRHLGEVAEAIPSVSRDRIFLVDGKDICWYGPRIAGALRRLQALLWGDR
jgi:ABC-type Fe3+-hydroxamate transport system substrate-binding protein